MTLSTDNPQGRLDVLAFRLLDRWAETKAPDLWQIAKPAAKEAIEKLLGPGDRKNG